MKQKINFATWSKYKNSIFDHFSGIKMAPPGGDIKFVFHRSKSKFPTLSHAKKTSFAYLYPKKVAKFLRGPKKRTLRQLTAINTTKLGNFP